MKDIRKIIGFILILSLITITGNNPVNASENKYIGQESEATAIAWEQQPAMSGASVPKETTATEEASTEETTTEETSEGIFTLFQKLTRRGASKKPEVILSSNKTSITIKWKGIKKSKIKSAQIKISDNQKMKNGKTINLNKKLARKMSYKLTTKSGAVKAGTTYYVRIRLKTGKKWSKWSGRKSVKIPGKNTTEEKTEEEEEDDPESDTEVSMTKEEKKAAKKYTCSHLSGQGYTWKEGETSQIVSVGDTVFDVHTYIDDTTVGEQAMFRVFLKTAGSIDYSKVSYTFDGGKTPGYLWDYITHDVEGYDGWIYSVPNYEDAMVDVFLDIPHAYVNSFRVIEETVPHDYDGTYTCELRYDGEVIGSQTRTKKACINKAIQLFKDYGGEEYVKEKVGGNSSNGTLITSEFSAVDYWQFDVFNYYGCQFGTILENMILRYYYDQKTISADEKPVGIYADKYIAELEDNTIPGFENASIYAPRYKQHQTISYGQLHVFSMSCDKNAVWTACGLTGSRNESDGYGINKIDMPYLDYYTPVYP